MATALPFPPLETSDQGLSSLARGIIGSEILKIAAAVRQMKAQGSSVCNLTVGDFDPAQFPIPKELREWTVQALSEGQTNYPPSDGVPVLREAIARWYERELGITYPVDGVLVAGGARPLIYGAYRTMVDPGDTVIYAVPSWNNNHYASMIGAKAIELTVTAETNFFPTADMLRPLVGEARVLMINSPLNPTGTVIDPDELRKIAELVVEENRRREKAGARPFYLVYDQVYWTLTFGKAIHANPVALVPEVAPYTLMLDAISKSFCATGLRVGWGVMPPAMRRRMADILGHVGAWAPKPEQMAAARLLDSPDVITAFHKVMKAEVRARLDALYEGISGMKQRGLPVDAIVPQGAIYLSVHFDLVGRSAGGQKLATNEDIRKLLLSEAGLAIVPFQAFGLREDTGWFRISVGAVSMDDIRGGLTRLERVLSSAVA